MIDATTMRRGLTVRALVERAASQHGDRELVELDPDGARRAHRLADVAQRALDLGRGLRALGVPDGAVVASLLGNHRGHLEALWGVPAAGLVLHPLNPRAPREALVHALRRAGDACLLADAAHADVARALQREAGVGLLVLAEERPRGACAWADVCFLGEVAPTPPDVDESRAAVMCEAAGTVGMPRAVAYSHRALVLHAMACAAVDGLALGRRDVVLPAMPLHHANGCGLPYTLALVGHGMVLLDPAADVAGLREALAREGVTFAAGMTASWVALASELEARPEGPRLRAGIRLLAGGNAAPEGMIRALAARDVEVLHVYGMTETGPLASASRGECAQGEAVPLMEMRVVDDAGEELPWDGRSVGEVLLRGPWVSASYVELGATPDRWTADGWLRTGDLGARDARGALRLTGRRKPLVRCGGRWIDTSALARIVEAHPAVASVTVRCVAHATLVEQPELTVVARPGARVDDAAVRAFVSARWTDGAPPPLAVVTA